MNELKNKRIAFHTLGCKVNIYESEVFMGDAVRAGAVLTEFTEKADVYVINTCSVTNIADRKSRQMIRRARKTNPDAVVVATGCYVETAAADVFPTLGADLFIGNEGKKDFVPILAAFLRDGTLPEKKEIGKVTEYRPECLSALSAHTRADIKIQDGCNQFCTYCIIPFARGRIRSKAPEKVIEEITALSEAGLSEFVLTGIHLSSYGLDFRENGQKSADYKDVADNDVNLLTLIEKVHAIPGVKRLRIGSLEPRIMTRAFAEGLARLPKVCPHFHLALQSGSDGTLKRMNRHYTAAEYGEAVQNLRAVYENPAITTDVITGFPGETEAEFGETLKFFDSIGFFEPNVFPYSRRHGTVADRMENQIPEETKKARSEVLIARGEESSERYRKSLLGKAAEVLTEAEKRPEEVPTGLREVLSGPVFTGHTREFVTVYTEGLQSGEIRRGILYEANGIYYVK